MNIWLFAFDDWIEEEVKLALLLDRAEREKAGSFHFADDRRRARLSWGIVRTFLGNVLDIRPQSLRFKIGPNGKPRLAPDTLRFNISHSKSMLAMAMSASEVGIDIEYDDPRRDVDFVASGVLREEELARYRMLDGTSRRRFLLRFWTECEALVKATGEGLSADIATFGWLSLTENTKRVLRGSLWERQCGRHAISVAFGTIMCRARRPVPSRPSR